MLVKFTKFCLRPSLPMFVRRLFRSPQGKFSRSQSLPIMRAHFGRNSVPDRRVQRVRTRALSSLQSSFAVTGNVTSCGRTVVPKGCVPVDVGEEQQRFVIPIGYLYHPFIVDLLIETENTFGYDQKGPLRIPCDVGDFEQLKWLIDREK
eukprot:Gb_31890 [translate_table: standard]